MEQVSKRYINPNFVSSLRNMSPQRYTLNGTTRYTAAESLKSRGRVYGVIGLVTLSSLAITLAPHQSHTHDIPQQQHQQQQQEVHTAGVFIPPTPYAPPSSWFASATDSTTSGKKNINNSHSKGQRNEATTSGLKYLNALHTHKYNPTIGRTIIVFVDGSEYADNAFASALRLKTHADSLKVVYFIPNTTADFQLVDGVVQNASPIEIINTLKSPITSTTKVTASALDTKSTSASPSTSISAPTSTSTSTSTSTLPLHMAHPISSKNHLSSKLASAVDASDMALLYNIDKYQLFIQQLRDNEKKYQQPQANSTLHTSSLPSTPTSPSGVLPSSQANSSNYDNISFIAQCVPNIHASALDVIHTYSADIAVVGNRGISPIKRVLLGSFSANLVAHAPCDIFVAKGMGHEVGKDGKPMKSFSSTDFWTKTKAQFRDIRDKYAEAETYAPNPI